MSRILHHATDTPPTQWLTQCWSTTDRQMDVRRLPSRWGLVGSSNKAGGATNAMWLWQVESGRA